MKIETSIQVNQNSGDGGTERIQKDSERSTWSI